MPPSTTGKLYKRQASELRLGYLQVRACQPASRHKDTASYLAHKNQRTVRHPELFSDPEKAVIVIDGSRRNPVWRRDNNISSAA